MSPVVIDSACLIALERIDQLDLLPRLFSDLVAPPAVVEEFGGSPAWLSVRSVSNQLSYVALRTQLQRGEAEAIALAGELAARSIILDDKKARRIAGELGLRPIGTVGMILRAKRGGLVSSATPLYPIVQHHLETFLTRAAEEGVGDDREAGRSGHGGGASVR